MQNNSPMVKKFNLKKTFPLILLIILCAIFTVFNSRFFTYNNFTIIAQQMVVTLIAALGMSFVIVIGSIDLSVGSIVALCALVTAYTVPYLGIFAFIPAILLGLLCGTINGVVFTKGKVPSFIVSMGAMVAYRGVVLLLTHGAPVEIKNMTFLNVFSGRAILNLPNSVLFAAGIFIVIFFVFRDFAISREVRAIGGAERVARLTGIRVDRTKIIVFMLYGFLAGLAGMFQAARVYAATPTLGEGMELDVIAAVVVGGTTLSGGVGSILGTLLGTFIISVLSNGMNIIGLTPEIQQIAKGIVLVLAVFATIDRSKIDIFK
jgi:ribose transport system permease protein